MRKHLLSLIVISGAGLLSYLNSFAGEFVFDDSSTVVNNFLVSYYRNFQLLWQINRSRFLPMLSFMINSQLAGGSVFWYHLVNFVIHIANGFLVYLLVYLLQKIAQVKTSLLKNFPVLPFFTALIFTVHPIQTGAVTYISQRITIIAAFFFMSCLTLYIKLRFIRDNPNHYSNSGGQYLIYLLLSLSMAGFAFISKENTFTLPLIIILMEIFLFCRRITDIKKSLMIILPFLLLTLVFYMLTTHKKSISKVVTTLPPIAENTTVTRQQYMLTQINVVRTYIRLLLLPVNQNVDYDYPITDNFWEVPAVLSFLFLTSFIVLAFKIYKKQRLISFGIFFFFLTLSIESSIFPITDVIFEHRLYLPSVGFFLAVLSMFFLVTDSWHKYRGYLPQFKSARYFFLLIIVIWLSVLTYRRNKVWQSEYSLWSDSVTKSPNKARVHYNLGVALGNRGNYQQAKEEFEKTVSLNSDYASAYNNLAAIYEMSSDFSKAAQMYQQVIRLEPDNLKARDKLKSLRY